MGNMTKSCKEMNFLKRKSINEDKRDSKEIKEAKEVKCDDLPPVSTNQINKSKENHNVNLDQKFNEDNFNEQDFENSFQSIQVLFLASCLHISLVLLFFFFRLKTIF